MPELTRTFSLWWNETSLLFLFALAFVLSLFHMLVERFKQTSAVGFTNIMLGNVAYMILLLFLLLLSDFAVGWMPRPFEIVVVVGGLVALYFAKTWQYEMTGLSFRNEKAIIFIPILVGLVIPGIAFFLFIMSLGKAFSH